MPKRKYDEKTKARLLLLLSIARISAEITMILGFFIFFFLILKWAGVF